MDVVYLIGFDYRESAICVHLPGVVSDLYWAWKYCNQYFNQIYILTDIKQYNIDIVKGVVDDELPHHILSFINLVKDNDQYLYINNKEDFINAFKSKGEHIFIYYSGHGENNGIITPDNQVVTISEMNTIINKMNTKESIIILDSCQPFNFNLRYELIDSRYIHKKNNVGNNSSNITIIFSCDSNNDSHTTRIGSIFTMELFRLLSIKHTWSGIQRELNKIMEPYGQYIEIHTGIPLLPLIPRWLKGSKLIIAIVGINLSIESSPGLSATLG